MKFPRYWAKGTVNDVDGSGNPVAFSCWRWSDVSKQDAHDLALAAARQRMQKVIAGEPLDRYGYSQRPMREEIKQEFADDDGQPIAVITQNGYGSLVLNTAQVMFVDIDFPLVSAGQQMGHFFKNLFGRGEPPPHAVAEAQVHDAVVAFVRDNRPWGGRLYRTHSGFRLLATHALFAPADEVTLATFKALAADPLYVRMCQAQQCFRARLTPKPWRCGQLDRFTGWPRETEDEQQRYEQWQADYLEGQIHFATCRFVESIGDRSVHPEVQPIVDIHDQVTRAGESCGLA